MHSAATIECVQQQHANVVLDHHAGAPDQLSPALTMLLGAPHYTDDDATVWPLAATDEPPEPCPLPALP